MSAHLPTRDRADDPTALHLADQYEVPSRRGAAEDAIAIRCIRSASSPHDRTFKQLLDFIRGDAMPAEMLLVGVVPLELDNLHT